MSAAKRSSLLPNLKRRLHELLAVIALVCGASALAQGSTVDCAVTSGACVAECSASGVIGSIFGGGSSADRNAKSAQCRANCERDRLTCQAQAAPSSPSTTAGAPVAGSTGALAGSASGAPVKPPAGSSTQQPADSTTLGSGPTSASGESVVLLSLISKPLNNVSQPVMYVSQALSEAEARQHMRPTWVGPAPVHQAEAGHALVIYGNPLMTRRKLVESTLAQLEQSGGKRSNVRVDVLSARASAPTPVGTSQNMPSPATAQVPPRDTPVSEISPLARKYNCTACHSVKGKLAGPSFQDIAAKYKAGAAPAATLLAFLRSPKIGFGGFSHNSLVFSNNDEVRVVDWVLAQ